eukprot:COSAG06_NODE_10189_length_1732_cov_1.278016_1_plen_64_part_10
MNIQMRLEALHKTVVGVVPGAFLMIRRQTRFTSGCTLFPYTTLVGSGEVDAARKLYEEVIEGQT